MLYKLKHEPSRIWQRNKPLCFSHFSKPVRCYFYLFTSTIGTSEEQARPVVCSTPYYQPGMFIKRFNKGKLTVLQKSLPLSKIDSLFKLRRTKYRTGTRGFVGGRPLRKNCEIPCPAHFSLVKLPNGKSKEMALFVLSNSLGSRLKENDNAYFPTQ